MSLLGYSAWRIRSDLKLVWGGVGWFRVHRGGWFGNVEGGLRSLRLISGALVPRHAGSRHHPTFLRTPTKTHRKHIGNAICAHFLPPTNWGNALGVSETLWAFPKHRGDRLGNEVCVWKRKLRFQGCRSNISHQNVVGNVNHVSDALFAFPKASSGTFPETLRKFPKSTLANTAEFKET